MNAQEQHIDYLLLGKYLAGEATPEEAMQVDEWLFVPGNKKQFEALEKIWNGLPGDKAYKLPDRMAAWRELQPMLQDMEPKQPAVVRRIFSKWYVAAGLLVATALVVFFATQKQPPKYITQGPFTTVTRDVLPDGSKIVLNRNSVVKYPDDFNDRTRTLQLVGECFFDVVHNRQKPFVIEVDNVKIKVIGTSFNIRQLHNPDGVAVQVKNGLVKMYTDKKELAVAKGQKGIYWKDQDEFSISDSVDVNSMSYATREFSFSSLSVEQLIPYLEDAYDVKIAVGNDKILQCVLSGRFADASFDQMMEVISVTLNLTYKKDGNTYTLNGEGCD